MFSGTSLVFSFIFYMYYSISIFVYIPLRFSWIIAVISIFNPSAATSWHTYTSHVLIYFALVDKESDKDLLTGMTKKDIALVTSSHPDPI